MGHIIPCGKFLIVIPLVWKKTDIWLLLFKNIDPIKGIELPNLFLPNLAGKTLGRCTEERSMYWTKLFRYMKSHFSSCKTGWRSLTLDCSSIYTLFSLGWNAIIWALLCGSYFMLSCTCQSIGKSALPLLGSFCCVLGTASPVQRYTQSPCPAGLTMQGVSSVVRSLWWKALAGWYLDAALWVCN